MFREEEPQTRRPNVRSPGSVTLKLTADDIMSLAINVVQNGWSQEECRPHTGDVEITLPDAVLHDVYAAMLMASRRAAAKRMGKRARPETEACRPSRSG